MNKVLEKFKSVPQHSKVENDEVLASISTLHKQKTKIQNTDLHQRSSEDETISEAFSIITEFFINGNLPKSLNN